MTRIEELRELSDTQWLTPLQIRELFTHIDARTAQVATLRAACVNARDALLRSDSRRRDPLVRDALDWLSDALRDSGGDTTT